MLTEERLIVLVRRVVREELRKQSIRDFAWLAEALGIVVQHRHLNKEEKCSKTTDE